MILFTLFELCMRNHFLSQSITAHRGSRQGCPLSPLLFVLYIERLAQWLRQTDNIMVLSIYVDTCKVALYADDVLIYISNLFDGTFKNWVSKGLTTFYSLIYNKQVKDFENRKTDFQPNNLDYFRYTQLRNYLQLNILSKTDLDDPVLIIFWKLTKTPYLRV